MNLTMDKIDEIFHLYEQYGGITYGENVTQLEHMSQCAQFAIDEGYDEEMVLAAFFHDIGHFLESSENKNMDIFGSLDHELSGSHYLLKKGFSKKIAALVASHVATKRYLTYSNPGYYLELSQASKNTLKFQGGPMNAIEALKFESNELFSFFIKIREWDDRAKVVGEPVKNLSYLKMLCRKHLANQKDEFRIF